MNKITIIGLVITILGIAMFLFGAAMFSYSGPALNPFVSDMGKYSFFFWLPTLIVGGAFLAWPKKRKKV